METLSPGKFLNPQQDFLSRPKCSYFVPEVPMVAKLFNYSWDFAQVPTEDSRGGKLKDFIDKED